MSAADGKWFKPSFSDVIFQTQDESKHWRPHQDKDDDDKDEFPHDLFLRSCAVIFKRV
ncbi:hypothetical protein DPMN_194956 [Dreissena polymorpha]|uniref:Uncharacterized protein n=1 Tax=Dreissena polymorpha TaxID=45954 RepID=A0A9D3Y514_DREPO|nr:hypothetical protein DPMN_194956 [Dreissena polymorpha]